MVLKEHRIVKLDTITADRVRNALWRIARTIPPPEPIDSLHNTNVNRPIRSFSRALAQVSLRVHKSRQTVFKNWEICVSRHSSYNTSLAYRNKSSASSS